jgi:trans-aconitate 2-methyltransferase
MRGLAGSSRCGAEAAWSAAGRESVGEPAEYLRILLDAGFAADAWETTYQQVLTGPEIRCWSGCGAQAFAPCWQSLSPDDGAAFEAEYGAAADRGLSADRRTARYFRSAGSSLWDRKL